MSLVLNCNTANQSQKKMQEQQKSD